MGVSDREIVPIYQSNNDYSRWTFQFLEGSKKKIFEVIMPCKTSDSQQMLIFAGQENYLSTCQTTTEVS